MKLNPKAKTYVPDSAKTGKTRYLAISAHQDDIEFMAYDGIIKAFDDPDKAFYAVVTTDGAGSARSGIYANYTDEEMKAVRETEQKKAAYVGNYGGLYLLNYTSSEVKDGKNQSVADDYVAIFEELKPEVVYTHNPLDKHDTHCGVVSKVIAAIRRLPEADRPKLVYGCEVWRALDWVCDDEKIVFDVSGHENLANALMGVFDSQIAGGKRYDAATIGRRRANATYGASHSVDTVTMASYAIDLTPLTVSDMSVEAYAAGFIDRFLAEQTARLKKVN